MRDEGLLVSYPGYGNPNHDGGIYTAVRVWFEDPAAAKAKYGPIASWDTSGVTYMFGLFQDRAGFNEDLSRWEVGQVEVMNWMFDGATSFTHQLGGAWSTSTAKTHCMFRNSPGTIAGKTKQAYSGTIA